MKATPLAIPDVVLLEPKIFNDERGFFFESFNQREFDLAIGKSVKFVQDNRSGSKGNVLRGLHYQIEQPQGKLVQVVTGEIFDVAVDIRRSSSNFGRWVGEVLSEKNNKQIWIPPGFAHGFVVLSNYAELIYKTTDYWSPKYERCILWDDVDIGIEWNIQNLPILSSKDKTGSKLKEADVFI